MVVLQKIWPVVGDRVVRIVETLIQLALHSRCMENRENHHATEV
jgi:hypothetical protein